MVIQHKINHIKIAEYFYLDEFQCPCCQQVMLYSLLLEKLIELRYKIEKPVIINSGYRCPSNNLEVGGVSNSYHLLGRAADIFVPKMVLAELFQAARNVGFTGIGFYPARNFLHLDIRSSSPVCWQG
ncbi:MAG TPA: D-Ala-D-Ala carboxypeptidase family metallohydrolase [Atribacterota bacterium]|nr:D-Ala-D-Ala carboxypeptidase family metallohydrolase [Atribacterota bacterium]